jgi:DNA-binding XRE family transcriptional regulator
MSRQSLLLIEKGGVPRLESVRAIVGAARDLTGKPVQVAELFDVGENEPPVLDVNLAKRLVRPRHKRSNLPADRVRSYPTRLDRVLRAERIVHTAFAQEIGVTRQSLLRFRTGAMQPSVATLAAMVVTLRRVTAKPYRAGHLYDLR